MKGYARVADVAEQIRGVTYAKEDAASNSRPGYLPVLRAGNISDDGLVFDDLVFVPAARIASAQKIRRNDVVIAASSGSLDVVGKAARALADFEGGFGAFCKVLRPRPGIDPAYFAHFFRTREYRQRVSALAAGANINNLRNEHLDEFNIPLPPLPEQRRIAEILDKADALRAKRRAALAQLDTLTQSIFLDIFGDPATNPKGWPRVALIDLCGQADDIKCGPFGTQLSQSEYTTEGIPLWGIRNVNAFFRLPTREFLTPRTAGRLSQYSIASGDIVMTRKGTVGNCAVFPEGFALGIMHSDLLRLRVMRERAEPDFIAHQLHHSRDVERQIALISGGAIMPGINVTKLKNLKVVVPPVSLQREFTNRLVAVEQLKASHESAVKEVDSLFASLQHRAFRGAL